ncbi:MAG: hypothetical protein JFAIHJKO_02900 [Pyrinomonadaceae bacterium]|nr:hypothetical protein [Pyrinomonadaceae bacterium]
MRRRVNDLKVRTFDTRERTKFFVVPERIVRAGDVPIRAVVGEDHPVFLHRTKDNADILAERRVVHIEARLQADAKSHRRCVRIRRATCAMRRGINVHLPCNACREAECMADLAGENFVAANESGEDR